MRKRSPITSGGNRFVCSDNFSATFMCPFRKDSFLFDRVSRHISCGLQQLGIMDIKSRIGRPNTHIAGDNFVVLSGVLRYRKIAL